MESRLFLVHQKNTPRNGVGIRSNKQGIGPSCPEPGVPCDPLLGVGFGFIKDKTLANFFFTYGILWDPTGFFGGEVEVAVFFGSVVAVGTGFSGVGARVPVFFFFSLDDCVASPDLQG